MTNTVTIVNNLKSILEKKFASRLMNMTISDVAKMADRLDAIMAPATTKKGGYRVAPKAKASKKKGKTLRRIRRRKLAPLNERIAEFMRGTSRIEWRSVGDIAKRSGESIPDTRMRHAMLKGYKLGGVNYPPVLKWNKTQRAGAKYRRIEA
jgi:hypothetical protein